MVSKYAGRRDIYRNRILDVIAGKPEGNWYDLWGGAVAQVGLRYGVTPEQAWGVFAAFSPRKNPVRNWAMLVKALREGPMLVTESTMPNRLKAYAILDGVHPLAVLTGKSGGMKTPNFFLNLSGDQNAVTVDALMGQLAEDDRTVDVIAPPMYREIELAVRDVATMTGWTPRMVQEVAWVTWRDAAPTFAGRHKNPPSIETLLKLACE